MTHEEEIALLRQRIKERELTPEEQRQAIALLRADRQLALEVQQKKPKKRKEEKE